jgi:hypothetical protein
VALRPQLTLGLLKSNVEIEKHWILGRQPGRPAW